LREKTTTVSFLSPTSPTPFLVPRLVLFVSCLQIRPSWEVVQFGGIKEKVTVVRKQVLSLTLQRLAQYEGRTWRGTFCVSKACCS